MSSTPLSSVEEYLRSTYRPDVDYLEGRLEERNLGEGPHSILQGYLGYTFYAHRKAWQVRTLLEMIIQISPCRYRVADLCVVRSDAPRDFIIRTPPFICIEIFSSNDTIENLQERVNDYFSMGVEHVWAIDPWQRRAYVCSPSGFLQPSDGKLRIEGTPIEVELSEVFAELDAISAPEQSRSLAR